MISSPIGTAEYANEYNLCVPGILSVISLYDNSVRLNGQEMSDSSKAVRINYNLSIYGVAIMAIDQMIQTDLPVASLQSLRGLTLFTPPGISVETVKYPILQAGILASPDPIENLSIYDHPESWYGLERDTILAMRRHLYSVVASINSREMQPRHLIDSLQTIALSVSPLAIGVEVEGLPPRHLHSSGFQVPTGPVIRTRSLEILSKPEISHVAKKTSEKDIPAAEGIWRLFEYDYSLEQIARMLAVGLLGMQKNRRMMPMKNAFRVVIDAFINRTIMNLIDRPVVDEWRIFTDHYCGDHFVVLIRPGEPRVDYVLFQQYDGEVSKGFSLDGPKYPSTDGRTAAYANSARFSAYRYLLRESINAHVTIFHHSILRENRILGAWSARAGVSSALQKSPIVLSSPEQVTGILDTILTPGLDVWLHDTPLTERIFPQNALSVK